MRYIVSILSFVICIILISCSMAGKKGVKSEAKTIEKKVVKTYMKSTIKKSQKTFLSRFVIYSPELVKAIDNDIIISIFKRGKYTEELVMVRGRKVHLLVSPRFDPKLTVPKNFYGSWDAIKYHKGNPLYVVDGCETNLGRMKRGLAPIYFDANKLNPTKGWGHYHPFELHHGGQKKVPNYFALMGEEHKIYSKVLHPKRIGSEISRNEFAKKERAPLYMDLSDEIAKLIK